jgi:hypothetical protein
MLGQCFGIAIEGSTSSNVDLFKKILLGTLHVVLYVYFKNLSLMHYRMGGSVKSNKDFVESESTDC